MGALSVVTIVPELLTLKDIVLRQRAADVPIQDTNALSLCRKLSLDMFEVMYATDGAALAAPQVGISLRLVVIDPANLDFGPHVLINPVIKSRDEIEEAGNEGCLSIPRRNGKVFRSTKVYVQAFNLSGELEEYHAEGWLARIFQHEIDHLDGFLYPDRMKPEDTLVEVDIAPRRKATAALKKLET